MDHLAVVWWLLMSSCIAAANTGFETCTSKGPQSSKVFKAKYCALEKQYVFLSCPSNEIIVLTSLQLAVKVDIQECMKRVLDPENAYCLDTCKLKGTQNPKVIKAQYCVPMKQDVLLSCPPNKIIVLTSLQLAVKVDTEECMKRVLDPGNAYCCNIQDMDVTYDGTCLKTKWNTDDTNHYQTFIKETLKKCTDTAKCILSSEKFADLQREISTQRHSSYFQVLYQCITAPPNPIRFCSRTTRKGIEIHFRGIEATGSSTNKTCTCSVTSQSDGNVKVNAVDVRTVHNGLHLCSKQKCKNISDDNLPLFGFNEIILEKKVNISLKMGSATNDKNLWLHVSATDGKDVNVICREDTPVLDSHSTATGQVLSGSKEAEYGSWPIVYLAAGAVFTLVIVVCVLGTVGIYRYRRKKKRHGQPSTAPSDYGYNPDGENGYSYAMVLDHTPQGRNIPISGSVSSQALMGTCAKPYPRPYPRSTSMRSLRDRPPMPPPPPPPNAPARKLENTSQPISHPSRTPGVSCDVSQLEAFLVGKEPVPSDGVSHVSSFQGSLDDRPRHHSPTRFGPRSRLQSNLSEVSNQRSFQGFESVPRSRASSPQCFDSVFESEGSVTESVLGKGNTPPQNTARDLLGNNEEVIQSLPLDNKEDETHNEYDIVIEAVMTRM